MGIDLKAARRDLLTVLYEAKASHVGSCLSALPILCDIYDQMKPEDDFVLSKGHAAAALYVVLQHKGIIDSAAKYLTGHVDHKVPGVKVSTGSLGHGLPIACGMAMRSKGRVYVLISDGELDCGTTWETAMFLERHNVLNLRIHVDCNGLKAFSPGIRHEWDVIDKFAPFGCASLVHCHTYPKGCGVSFMENKLEWHYKNMSEQDYILAMEENR